jgi:hypothetical protein
MTEDTRTDEEIVDEIIARVIQGKPPEGERSPREIIAEEAITRALLTGPEGPLADLLTKQ